MVCLPLPTLQGKFKTLKLKLNVIIFYKYEALLVILTTIRTSYST